LLADRPSPEEDDLLKRATEAELEAEKFNLPATFMVWAKKRRDAMALHKELLKLQEARRLRSSASWRKTIQRVLGYRQMALFAGFFFVLEPMFVKAPLLEFSSAWLWPIGRFAAMPNYSAGSISVLGWSFVCQRFASRALPGIFGA